MGKVVLDITTSLDGYVTGPDDKLGQGLGVGGERLHYWVFGREWTYDDPSGSATGVDKEVLDEVFASTGAVVVGRRTYDVTDGWGGSNPWDAPCFVVTHQAPANPGTGYTYVTDGIDSALTQARAAAGDKDVSIGGGADIAQQCLRAGLVDEIQLHLAPVLLGAGKRLFHNTGATPVTLERTRVLESPYATHLRFRVVR